MLRVDLEAQNRAGREVLIARQPFLQVPYRDRQLLDREIARVAHRDERAAVGDELFQVVEPRLADPAAILGPDRVRLEPVDDRARILIRDDDCVELRPQLAGADVRVVDRRQVELVLLEHPPRPPLVHVAAGPRLVHRDARSVKRNGFRVQGSGFRVLGSGFC